MMRMTEIAERIINIIATGEIGVDSVPQNRLPAAIAQSSKIKCPPRRFRGSSSDSTMTTQERMAITAFAGLPWNGLRLFMARIIPRNMNMHAVLKEMGLKPGVILVRSVFPRIIPRRPRNETAAVISENVAAVFCKK